MTDCEHIKTSLKKNSEEFLGHKFSFKAETCDICEAVLWDDVVNKKFQIWINSLYKKHADLFVVQPRFTKQTLDSLDQEINSLAFSVNRAVVLRAMSYVYIDDICTLPDVAEHAAGISVRPAYEYFDTGPKRPVKVRVRPHHYLDLLTWSKLTGLSPARIIEKSTMSMLALIKEQTDENESYQAGKIREMMRSILRAA